MKPVNDNKLRIKVKTKEELRMYLDAIEHDMFMSKVSKKLRTNKVLDDADVDRLHSGLTALINVEPCS